MPRSWIAVFVALVLAFLWFFGFNTVIWFETRAMVRQAPVVEEQPIELTDTSISSAKGLHMSYLGYEFESPWGDVDTENTKLVRGWAVIKLQSGNGMVFHTFPANSLVKELLQSTKNNAQQVRALYGDEAMKSDYDFKRAVLYATPQQLTPFSSRRKLVRGSVLLILKSATLLAGSRIYNIQNGGLRGFQYGDPALGDARVVDDLFGDGGGVEFVFLKSKNPGAASFTQADINRVLQTLVADPVAPTAAAASKNY